MMTSLHDRLTDLAETAPAGPRPPDLWERGRRYGRRRRIEAAALTLVLLGAVGSLVGAVLPATSYDVGPADAEASLRLPDEIERPSSWLRGTDDGGPIGPMVALFPSARSSGLLPQEDEQGLVAVAAAGDYAFLDLPDGSRSAVRLGGVALSPDGRLVAYPLTGATREEPNRTEGDAVVGLGVYDTVTGDVQRLDIATDHGLGLHDLTWVGHTVRFSYGHYADGGSETDDGLVTDIRPYSWDVTERPASAEQVPDARDVSGVTADGRVVTVENRRVRVEPGDAGGVDVRLDVLPEEGGVALSPSGEAIALLEDTDGANMSDAGVPKPLRYATVPASGAGAVETVLVPGVEAHALRGWRDDQHVVVEDFASPGLDSVDLETGDRERLVRFESGESPFELVVAADVLQAPTYDADGAPYVMAPLQRVGLAALAVLLAGLAVLIWRRRGRV